MAMNVASFAIKLGIDPSAIPSQLRGVTVNLTSEQRRLAAEMKSTAQSGVLSARMLSEAWDLGLSRPLTRYLTQTFPALSKALSSLVAPAALMAGVYYGMEAYERLSKKIEEAAKKEEEYAEAVQKTKMVIGAADASSEERLDKALAKNAALRGDKQGEIKFKGLVEASEAVKQTAEAVEKLTEAELKEARAAQDRMQTWAVIGRFLHETFTSDSTLGVEKINKQMETFGREFDLRSVQDQINHTHTAFDFLAKSEQDAKNQLADLQKAQTDYKPKYLYTGPGAGPPTEKNPVSDKEVAAAKKLVDLYKELDDEEARRKKAADQENANDVLEAAKTKGDKQLAETKRELEAIDKVVNSLRDKAAAEGLAAEATGRGSAASMQAAAAATAEKEISDRLAEASEKFKLGDITAKQFAQVKSAIEAATPAIQQFALASETAKASGEYNRALAEFNLRTREHIAALDEEAAGVGRVAKEQAKQAEGLLALEERYEALYGKSAPGARPAIGPPTAQQSAFEALQGARSGLGEEQGKTQTTAFITELAKVKAATVAASDPSPWARTETKLQELQIEYKLTSAQAAQLGAAMHAADSAGAIEKLTAKVTELAAVQRALLAGSPYPQIEAEVQKLALDYRISADAARQLLTTTQQLEASNKAIESVRAIQPGGAGSRVAELEREAAAVRDMAAANKDNENVQLAARLRLQEISAEEDAILLKTEGIGAGFHAWVDALQAVESEGQFVFGLLTQATKGFEATAADSLVKILETHKDQHAKLIHELRQMWEGYFAGLAKMAIQHGLQKLLQPIADSFAKKPDDGSYASGSQSGAKDQMAAGPGMLFSALGKGKGNAALTANTTALGSNTQALIALTAKMTASQLGGAASSAGANAADTPGMMAEGGDVSPGGSFISGESGAERVDLERGGAHVTPLGVSVGGGGDTHNHYDMRGAVVTDDLMRKADAAAAMARSETRAVARAVNQTQEIAKRSRPSR